MDRDQTVYALLVGIDIYHPDSTVPHLAGCKNDIMRINRFFSDRIGERYNPKLLLDHEATKENIIAAFQTHLATAKKGDSVLFYYSGHGSQSMTAREFWRIEPDKLDETIVAYDSRTQSGSDLADKELAYLIGEVAKGGAHITIVMDCCHSGSGTRQGKNMASRRMLTDERPRSNGDRGYFFMDDSAAELGPPKSGNLLSGWIDLPKGDHVLLSACRSFETAKEKLIEGERRGIFSHYLLETLQTTDGTLTYRDLFMRTNALVRAEVAEQSPQLDTTGEVSLNQPFLGGLIEPVPEYFSLSFVTDHQKKVDLGWFIDAGEVNGIKQEGSETTELAVFNLTAQGDALRSLDQAVALIRVTAVEPTRSKVELLPQDGFEPDTGTTYKAVITGLPVPPLLVSFEGDPAGIDLIRTALSQSAAGQPSLTVQEADEDKAGYKVTAANNRFVIQRHQDGYALAEGTDSYSAKSAATIVKRLEHIARWQNLLKLTNPQSSISPSDIKIKMEKKENNQEFVPVEQGSEVSLLSMGPDEGQEAILKFRVTNKSRQRLFFMFLVFGEAYEIHSLTEGDEINGKWLGPKESFSLFNDLGGIPAYIPAEQWEKGINSYKQTIKIIATTEESFAEYFQQDELPIEPVEQTRSIRSMNDTLSRLMQRSTTRTMGRRKAGQLADWTTIEVGVTINQPKGERLPAAGNRISPTPAITIEGHSTFTATAELASLPAATRSAGATGLPHIMRDNPNLFTPVELSGSRAGEPGLSVLDLSDAKGLETVSASNPLEINLALDLAENESLLALGVMDGFLVPLDIVNHSQDGQTKVELDYLPSAAVVSRSLKKSVRILFQKYAHSYLGTPYQYPQLACISLSETGAISYDADLTNLKSKVAGANKIAVYIHGIFGSTNLMATSSQTQFVELPSQIPGITDSHDLILAFDYENLDTPIEDVAFELKQKLAEIGLTEGHGKTFNIIAHSLGGLVARWFIEYLEGNKVVNHLVMLGTPNAGTPFSKIEDWLLGMATIGLNSLAVTTWPLSVLNSVLAGIEKVDVTLDQMNPNSDFLKNLSRSPDPQIPYTIIAGNTSIIPSAIGTEDDQGIVPKLWTRFASKNTAYKVVDFAFWHAPNDLGSSVDSMRSIPASWTTTKPTVLVVPSDHLSYFNLEAGLKPLADALE